MVQVLAQLIGTHALEFIFILVVIVLAAILLLWRLFELYYLRLWEAGRIVWHNIARLAFVQWLGRRYPRLWPFLGERLSADGYLGLHLAVGLLLSVAALVLFASIADNALEHETLAQFDQSLAITLHQNATVPGVIFFVIITELGSVPVMVALVIVVATILIIHHQRLLAASWIVTIAGGAGLNLILKVVFQRPRPEFTHPFLTESSWSFPSGHAMSSLIAYGMLAYLLVITLRRPWPKLIVVTAVVLVMLIGFSRLYLGVHYFSDVMAGYTVGTVWLAASISGVEIARRRKQAQQSPQPEHLSAPR